MKDLKGRHGWTRTLVAAAAGAALGAACPLALNGVMAAAGTGVDISGLLGAVGFCLVALHAVLMFPLGYVADLAGVPGSWFGATVLVMAAGGVFWSVLEMVLSAKSPP